MPYCETVWLRATGLRHRAHMVEYVTRRGRQDWGRGRGQKGGVEDQAAECVMQGVR